MRRLDARLPHDDTLEVDWSTLDFDVDDPDIARRVHETFGVDRSRQTTVGGRLTSLAEAAGLVPLAETTATQVRPSWDPDELPRPDGWAPMVVMAASLVEADRLGHDLLHRRRHARHPRHPTVLRRPSHSMIVPTAPVEAQQRSRARQLA